MEFTTNIIFALEILGIIAFAVSGTMIGIERELDLFGIIVLGVITALGGGMIRDILLGKFPPVFFVNYTYTAVAFAATVLSLLFVFVAGEAYRKRQRLIAGAINLFDALGLGTFTVLGERIAIEAGFGNNVFLTVTLGVITGIGGGLLRDIMSNQTPFVLKKRIYALASLFGGVLYLMFVSLRFNEYLSIFSGIAATSVIRVLATLFCWDLPRIPRERVCAADPEDL